MPLRKENTGIDSGTIWFCIIEGLNDLNGKTKPFNITGNIVNLVSIIPKTFTA